jgi:hypothetical protein
LRNTADQQWNPMMRKGTHLLNMRRYIQLLLFKQRHALLSHVEM